ncbi:MAG: winged helix-turn-helix transcriptional regulator [Actinobacteria bacterium]|nr:MAG: winged helix-turn-helix transcriptional regulator [Actinomycetota bacterium]
MSTGTERRRASENRIRAMSHPLRAAILRILSERTASPAEMARELGAELSNVSYHAKQLVAFECAELVDIQVVRGALEHFYRATELPLIDIEEWLTLDEQGLREALAAHERTRLEILEIEARSAARLVAAGEAGVNVSSSQACFQMPATERP